MPKRAALVYVAGRAFNIVDEVFYNSQSFDSNELCVRFLLFHAEEHFIELI